MYLLRKMSFLTNRKQYKRESVAPSFCDKDLRTFNNSERCTEYY